MLPLLAQDPLRKVLQFCTAHEVLQYGNASKKAQETLTDDLVWRGLASRDFYGERRRDEGLSLGVRVHSTDPADHATMYFKIQPFTPLQRVFDAVAKRKDAAVETLCFVLDGSRIRGNLTLEDLDITAEQHLDCLPLADAPSDEFLPSASAAFSAPSQAEAPVISVDGVPCDRVDACDSWLVAYRRWFSVARRVQFKDQSFEARAWMTVARAWRDIKAALAEQSMDAIVASLRPPAAPEALRKVGVRSLRYAYAIHDGQALAFDEARRRQDRAAMRDSQHSVFHGLFGGVSAYDYVVCTRFVSITEAMARSPPEDGIEDDDTHDIHFAANYDGSWRFVASANDGSLRLPTGGGSYSETMFANDGQGLAAAAPETHDAFAQWFATFAARVRLRAYRAAPLLPDAPDGTRGVVLFPDADAGDDCHVSEAITRGIRVRASAVYLPNSPSGYAYSIRIRRVSDDAPESCQLRTRHWHINDGERTSTVSGEGVVGKFPVLTSTGWRDDSQVANMTHGFSTAVLPGEDREGEFVYQSFSGMTRGPRGGSFRGELEFVPGEVSAPTGEPFRVVCPEFALRKPRFLY